MQRCTRRMWQLQFISAGDKFAAIPKASGCFAAEEIYTAGNNTHYPAGNVVDFSKIHKGLFWKQLPALKVSAARPGCIFFGARCLPALTVSAGEAKIVFRADSKHNIIIKECQLNRSRSLLVCVCEQVATNYGAGRIKTWFPGTGPGF